MLEFLGFVCFTVSKCFIPKLGILKQPILEHTCMLAEYVGAELLPTCLPLGES